MPQNPGGFAYAGLEVVSDFAHHQLDILRARGHSVASSHHH